MFFHSKIVDILEKQLNFDWVVKGICRCKIKVQFSIVMLLTAGLLTGCGKKNCAGNCAILRRRKLLPSSPD